MSPARYSSDRSLLASLDASDLLLYAVHDFHSDHCLFNLASRGLERAPEAQMSPISVFRMSPVRYYRDRSLLASLDASNLLQYATHNFWSYHCLFGLAPTGLQRPPEAQMSPNQGFRDVSRVILSRCITSGHLGASDLLQYAIHNF